MGVDIHAFIEVRDRHTDKWSEFVLYKKDQSENQIPIRFFEGQRNYELFGLLAGISSFEIAYMFDGSLIPNRGLPSGLSQSVANEYGDGEFYFGETWYDYCELSAYSYSLKMCFNIIKKNKVNDDSCDDDYECDDNYNVIDALDDFVKDIDYVLNAYDKYHIEPNDVRIVMWFDH